MLKPFKTKKGIEISFSKIISLTIVIIVVAVILFNPTNSISEITNWGIDSTNRLSWQKEYEMSCEISSLNCDRVIKDCSKKKREENDCSQEEKEKYEAYQKVIDCDIEPDCEEEQQRSWDEFKEKYFEEESESGETQVFSNEEIKDITDKIDTTTGTTQTFSQVVDKMPTRVKATYEKLLNIKITPANMNGPEYLEKQSKKNNINPILPLAVITQESKGDPNAISYTGCAGLFQFCYNTAYKDFSHIFGTSGKTCKNRDISTCSGDARFDPQKAIDAGTEYLAQLNKRYNGNIILILTAYNAGGVVASKCNDASYDNSETYECVKKATAEQYKCPTGKNCKEDEVATYISKITKDYETMIA